MTASTQNSNNNPRAIIHKKILDAAADKPDASVEAIAEDIPSATGDLVERVLDEYGDPGMESQELNGDSPESSEQASEDTTPDPEDLSETERETLRVIAAHPQESQRDIADRLGVTAATVSNRIKEIEGVEWANRETVTSNLFENHPTPAASDPEPISTPNQDQSERVDQLTDRVDTIERQLEGSSTDESGTGLFDDPELLRKLIHAAMTSDQVTEDEELQIIERLIC